MEETPSIICLVFVASAVICDCKVRHGVGGDGNCSDSVGFDTHRLPHDSMMMAVGAGGGGMACMTVGVRSVAAAMVPVAMATVALAGKAVTADRTVSIVGHWYVQGDEAIGPAVMDAISGCSPGTAVGADDGGIIWTAEAAGDGGMVPTGCHTVTAVGAGGGEMACTTVGVGDSSMAHTTVGAGDDGTADTDCHTAVGAGGEGACDGEVGGIDCHTAVGAGNVWLVCPAGSDPKSALAMVTGSAVGAVRRTNRRIPSA